MGKRTSGAIEPACKDGPNKKRFKGVKAGLKYERSHERFTWKGVLSSHRDKKFKIVPPPCERTEIDVIGSCTWLAVASALQSAFRACGIEVGQLAWEDLYEMVGPDIPYRITACLRVLKYKGIRTKADYLQGNTDGKRFRISQYTEYCNIEAMVEGPCGLDKDNLKAAINNSLSKSPMICFFPISENYHEFKQGTNHIYQFDESLMSRALDGRCPTHTAVVTSFGFEEDIPYFQCLDCETQGDKGFVRILPSSIFSLFGFDIVQD